MGGDRKEVDIESDPDDPKETSDKEKSNEGKEKHKEQIETRLGDLVMSDPFR